MSARIRLHDRQYELNIFRSRAVFAGAVCVCIMLLLLGRLIYLQVVNHELFSTLSLNNRLQLKAIAPTRGLIYDRNGIVLAENRPMYLLEVTPEEVTDMEATLSGLSEVINLSVTDIERFRQFLRDKRKFEAVPLRFNLDETEVAHFAINRHRFPGVDIAARLTRYYPFGASMVHVLGYMGRIDQRDLDNIDESNYRATTHIGKLGIEQNYEAELHGTAGYQQVEVNVQGRVLRVVEENPPIPGKDLYLTLDIHLQQVAEEALGEESGAVVAIDPRNGAVRVLVSKPGYDPHDFVHGISNKEFNALQNSPMRPLFNRALTGQYPPGSTLKPILGLGALEESVEGIGERVHCRGYYRLAGDDRRYRDWKKQGHGSVDLSSAIEESCDVFFYDLAYRMGIDAMAAYLGQFGLGRMTGIDISGEKKGLIPTSNWKRERMGMVWFPGETLIAGIGQGYMLATPLQLAHAVAGLATGESHRPQLLAAMRAPGKETVPVTFSDTALIPVRRKENWRYIREAMEAVVHGKRGTARGAGFGAKYRFAGKTGTAQVISIAQDEEYDEEAIAKRHRDHAWFIAYAPAESPRLAIAVLVENGGHGSSAAAPVARKVFDRFFEMEAANVAH
ncbi:MAG TPA: penicillin-binding protein 2 [Gammaproteobacteria bacterium]